MITAREALEVDSQLHHSISWKSFRDFLVTRKVELDLESDTLSENITNLLKREQAIGAKAELAKLLEAFTIHVANITITEKQEKEHE